MSIGDLDLNLLLLLDTVLAEGSVARAARRLHVTPSAISNGLARLRIALGDPLLARKGRGIVPTPRAVELAPLLARALRELESAVRPSAFDPLTSTRTFTLAIADVGQTVLLPRIAALLAKSMPQVRLRVVGVQSLVSLGGVAGTEVDVAIGVPETVPGIHRELLFEEPTVLAASTKHRKKTPLASLKHVAVEMVPGKGFADRTAIAWAKAGLTRTVVLTVPTFTTAAAVVAATSYVTTLPRSLFRALDLAIIQGAPADVVPMHMWWHERTHADPALVAFRALLRRALK